MKQLFLMAIAAATMFSSCAKQDENGQGDGKPKSLEFSLGVTTPETRMIDGTVTSTVVAEVRANITKITIEYFNSANATLGTYDFTSDQITTVKSDNQAGTRVPVRLNNIPAATAKVNVYLNVKTSDKINELQTSYNVMEYRGSDSKAITLKTAGGGNNGNDLYEVEVSVQPTLSRFEFTGDASDIVVNSSNGGTLPTDLIDGTKEAAQKLVSDATILAAEAAAREAWIQANPSQPEPTWTYTYTVKYAYNPAYTIDKIEGYYINNIPLTPTGALVLNANNAAGDWNDAAKTNYGTGGSMEKMCDITNPTNNNVIAYNLFPQQASGSILNDVKTEMPHFLLKLKTSIDTRWITVRAFRSTAAGNPLIDRFEAGKAYVLDAGQIVVNQYSAKLSVTANGVKGPEIPEVIDPTDPDPEPQGKDLDLLVKIVDWTVVYVKPEW